MHSEPVKGAGGVVIVGRRGDRPDPKRPRAGLWSFHGTDAHTGAEVWLHAAGMTALSAVEIVTKGPEDTRGAPEFHVSVSFRGGRANREQTRQVRADFGMQRAFEDNHVPNGVVRNFWLPVDPKTAPGCACEANEPPHDEGDDYVWREAPEESR